MSINTKADARIRQDVFAQYKTGAEEMTVSFYPDRSGMTMDITHNWCDGKRHPLTRPWRTKVLRQLGFQVLRWDKTDWGEQATFKTK